MKLELKNLRKSQQRVNDLRAVGKPHTLKGSIDNKGPYSQEFVMLDMGDWQTFDKIVARSIAEIHQRRTTLSDALMYRTVMLNEDDRYSTEGLRPYKEYKLDWNSHTVR